MKTLNKTVTVTLSCFLLNIVPALAAATEPLPDALLQLQHGWATANYATVEKQQERAFDALLDRADVLIKDYPEHPEPLVWKAIILSTEAGVVGGLGALGKAKAARKLLEKAEAIEPTTLQGSIYTSLGSLYYKVPGWPIGFGDDDKAASYLQKALAINPQCFSLNYFYAQYIYAQGNDQEAYKSAVRARAAAPRKARPLADKGRQQEIQALLDKLQQKLASVKDTHKGGGLWN